MTRATAVLGLAAVLAAAAGCAGVRGRPVPVDIDPRAAARETSSAGIRTLEERAQAYWARREARDLAGAYPFYCSDYRARVPLEQFVQMKRLIRFELRDVQVVSRDGDNERANVTIAYRFVIPFGAGALADGRATHPWRRGEDGQWCKEDEPVELPFPKPSAQAYFP